MMHRINKKMMHRINKKIAWIQAVLILALSAASCSETEPTQTVPVLDSETELSPQEETFTEYLEKKLKFKVNTEKSRAVSVYSIRNFDFLAL